MKRLKAIARVGKGGLVSLLTLGILVYAGTEIEWNNNQYGATPIGENSITTGETNSWDPDYFKFTPTSDTAINIQTSDFPHKMILRLQKGCGYNQELLVSKTAASNGENVLINYSVTAGQEYCIDLVSDNSANKSYTLTLATSSVNHPPVTHPKVFDAVKNTTLTKNLLYEGGVADSDIDGDTLTASKLTNPSHGTLSVSADGSFSYTPKNKYVGEDSFTYTVSDGNGGTASGYVRITVIGYEPIANDKNFAITLNNSITSNMLTEGGVVDYDPQGTVITKTTHTAPSHGTISGVDSSGNFTYTPNTGFIGTDMFTYTITDGTLTDTATVSIQVYAIGDEPFPPIGVLPGDTDATGIVCSTFEDVLQTRNPDTVVKSSSGGEGAAMFDNPDCTLNTGDVVFGTQKLKCGSDIATESGLYGSALTVNYSNPPDTSVIILSDNPSTLDYTSTTNETLTESFYRNVDIGTGGIKYLNVDMNHVEKIASLDFTIGNRVTFSTPTPYTLEIGSVGVVNNGSGNTLKTATIPKNIKINTFDLAGATTVDFTAEQTIKINSMQIGRQNSSITLKAPYVKLNSLTQSNAYSDGSSVTIIADYIDIGTLDLQQMALITIKPYTPGKRILFRANSISASSSSSMIVYSGNYYTKSFSIPGTSDSSSIRAADANQLINFYIDGDFNPGNNPGINSTGNKKNFGTLPSANFILFISGNLNVGNGGTTFNATIYVGGSASLGTETYIKGALSSSGNITIGNNSEFYYDQTIDDAGWGECSDGSSINVNLDAWDVDASPSDRHIKTKIVAKAFSLKIVSLNETNNYSALSDPLKVRLVETSSCPEGDANLTAWQDIDLSVVNPGLLTFTAASASKDVKIQFQKEGTTTTRSCSTDNFAIRPERFAINSTNAAMPNLLRAGENYNVSVNAYDYGAGGPLTGTHNTVGYTLLNAHTILTIDPKLYDKEGVERNLSTTPKMYGTPSFNVNNTFDIQDGISVKTGFASNEVASLTFDDVGQVNLNIQDRTWAMVDTDDTLQTCDADGAYICGDKSVTFIPDHFEFETLTITNNNGKPGSFTYIANEVADMAARIDTNIRALNKANSVTKNFSTYPLYENSVTIIPVVRKQTYKYPDANETTINNLSIGFVDGNRTIRWNESNTSKILRFNFKRDYNQTASPFDLNGSDLNISIVSNYTDSADGDSSNISGDKNQSAAGKSTFVYGRIIPKDIRVFGAVPFSANAWYEVYDASSINSIVLQPSRNDSKWFVNTLHSDTNDGDGNVTVLKATLNITAVTIPSTYASGVENFNFAARTPPYSAKAHINTDPWLWYGVNASAYLDPSAAPVNVDCLTHPCFNINIAPSMGRVGSATSSDLSDKKANKATSTTTGLIYDYTPSTR